MPTPQETIDAYRVKRAQKIARQGVTCSKCPAICTGANISLGRPLCDRCQDQRLAEQSTRS